MIKTVNLTKVFRTDEVETTALNNVSFGITPGILWLLWDLQDAVNRPC